MRKCTNSVGNDANQYEKTTIMKGFRSLCAPASEQQLRAASSFFVFALRENISVVIKIRASLHILAFIVEHSVALSFCINSKLFIIELCSPGDRKVLNQHVPLTETKLLIFPELPPPPSR